MSKRIIFKLQFLEKLAAPLLAAVASAREDEPAASANDDPATEARQVATLLGRSVALSGEMAGILGIRQTDETDESARIALSAVAGQLLSSHYQSSGRMPDEGAEKRMMMAMQAAIGFADNYTGSLENIARLERLEPDSAPADEAQRNIQYVRAIMPLISAIARYPFGRDEKKLALEVLGRLTEEAQKLVVALSDRQGETSARQATELQALQTLVTLYTDCHEQSMTILMNLPEKEQARLAEENGGKMPMDDLWREFSTGLAMLYALAGVSKPGVLKSKGQSSVAPSATNEADVPQSAVAQGDFAPDAVQNDRPQDEAAGENTAENTGKNTGEEASAANAGPMSFFGKNNNNAAQEDGADRDDDTGDDATDYYSGSMV